MKGKAIVLFFGGSKNGHLEINNGGEASEIFLQSGEVYERTETMISRQRDVCVLIYELKGGTRVLGDAAAQHVFD